MTESKEDLIQECLEYLRRRPDVPSIWQEMYIQLIFGTRLANCGLSARDVCRDYAEGTRD
jgi:hypothetical protein